MRRISHRMVLAPAELPPTELYEKTGAILPVNGSIDFSKEIGLLSLQRAEDGPIISNAGYVNFAALYLETARRGPTKVLQIIRR